MARGVGAVARVAVAVTIHPGTAAAVFIGAFVVAFLASAMRFGRKTGPGPAVRLLRQTGESATAVGREAREVGRVHGGDDGDLTCRCTDARGPRPGGAAASAPSPSAPPPCR